MLSEDGAQDSGPGKRDVGERDDRQPLLRGSWTRYWPVGAAPPLPDPARALRRAGADRPPSAARRRQVPKTEVLKELQAEHGELAVQARADRENRGAEAALARRREHTAHLAAF